MDACVLAQVLRDLPQPSDPNLLIGYSHASDAGVYRIAEDQALVQTVDFFTPIVDDPYEYGQIAAANSVSDVYAMGGRPITALNILAIPSKKVAPEIVGRMLAGGHDKAREAGCLVIGGHTVENPELMYGMSVTGLVSPDRLVTNERARPGDVLVLTKALGTGIATTAVKLGQLPEGRAQAILRATVESMLTLNRRASELMVEAGASAATDVTGFGFLGHAYEFAAASNVTFRIEARTVPVLECVLELASQGVLTGGDRRNRQFTAGHVELGALVGEPLARVLFDPQTSGGLLIALPEARASALVDALAGTPGLKPRIVGHVTEAGPSSVVVG